MAISFPAEAPTNIEGTVEQYANQAHRLINQLKTGEQNADFTGCSEEQKADIKKIASMHSSGGLTEYGAIDMATKVLEWKSMEAQYSEAFKMNTGMEKSRSYRDIQEPKPGTIKMPL